MESLMIRAHAAQTTKPKKYEKKTDDETQVENKDFLWGHFKLFFEGKENPRRMRCKSPRRERKNNTGKESLKNKIHFSS